MFGFLAEKGIKKNYSFNLSCKAYNTNNYYANSADGDQSRSTKLTRGYVFIKKYFSKTSFLRKWYLAPYLNSGQLDQTLRGSICSLYSETYIRTKYYYIGAGAFFGYQFLTKKGLCIDLNVGLGLDLRTRYWRRNTNVYFMPSNPRDFMGDGNITIALGYNLNRLFNKKVSTKDAVTTSKLY